MLDFVSLSVRIHYFCCGLDDCGLQKYSISMYQNVTQDQSKKDIYDIYVLGTWFGLLSDKMTVLTQHGMEVCATAEVLWKPKLITVFNSSVLLGLDSLIFLFTIQSGYQQFGHCGQVQSPAGKGNQYPHKACQSGSMKYILQLDTRNTPLVAHFLNTPSVQS